MSRDGAGNYTLPGSAFVAGTTAVAADVNSKLDDIASALTASLAKDGQTSPTADLPMANFKHTSVGNAAARTQYASAAQVQDGAVVWAGTTGGTSTAYTATVSPGSVALVSGLTVRTKLNATCGASPTFALNGLTAKNIAYFCRHTSTIQNARVGDLVANQTVELTYESGQDKWLITSPLADPFTWYTVSESVSGSSQAAVDFNVPSTAVRLRFEFSDCSPSAVADMYMRVNRGAGFLSGGSDYIWIQNNAPATTSNVISLVGDSVAEPVTGFAEMQVNAKNFGYAMTTSVINPPSDSPDLGNLFAQSVTSFACVNSGADITQVRFAFVGVDVATHRIRMLTQRL